MALSELYEIGKRSRNPLAGVSKAARRGKGGGSLVTPLDEHDEEAEVKSRSKTHHDGNAFALTSSARPSSDGVICMICRVQTSKYNCPTCNIAYCSVICYRSKKHESCSRPFLQKALKEELGSSREDRGMVDEDERRAMMDVLRRMKLNGTEAEQDEEDENGGEASLKDEDAGEEVNVDDASIEQLLSMLSPEEKARFQAAVEDQDPNQARARSLFDKILQIQQDQIEAQPWWVQNDKFIQPSASPFTHEVEMLSKQPSKASTANIRYNLLALLLTYAYIVRYIDVHSLQDLDVAVAREDQSQADQDDMPPLESSSDGNDKDNEDIIRERQMLREIVISKLKLYAPFLAVSGEASTVLLEGAEQVTLSFATAHLKDSATSELAAKTLCFLYKDVLAIITPPNLVEIDSSSSDNADKGLLALSDLNSSLSPPSQKKLLFYGVYWLRLDGVLRKDLQDQVEGEMKRLEAEVQQVVDQERFQAANEAAQQQTVYY